MPNRTHPFDEEGRKKENLNRKCGTTGEFRRSARGATGVRAFHKSDETKIMSHRLAGIELD